MTPTLLSLAAGLVVSHLVVRVADSSGRATCGAAGWDRRSTAYGLDRRPAVRKVLTIITVAIALAVFAANAVVVGRPQPDGPGAAADRCPA